MVASHWITDMKKKTFPNSLSGVWWQSKSIWGNMKEGWSLLPVEVGVEVGGSRKYSIDRWYFSCEWWANLCQEPGRLGLGEGDLKRGSKGKTVQALRRHWGRKGSQVCCIMANTQRGWTMHWKGRARGTHRGEARGWWGQRPGHWFLEKLLSLNFIHCFLYAVGNLEGIWIAHGRAVRRLLQFSR